MRVKFYLKSPNKAESLILARILWGNHQINLSTKETVAPKFWIKNNEKGERIQGVQRTNKYIVHASLNDSLDHFKILVRDAFLEFKNVNGQKEPTPAQLKEILNLKLGRGKKPEVVRLPTFMEYFKDFIDRSKRGVRVNRKTGQALSVDTIKTYNTLLVHLEEYNKYLDWQEINLKFHADYTGFLIEEYELSNSSIGKDFQILKTVCEEAYYEKINPNDDYKSPFFSVTREAGTSIHLNPEEIGILFNLNLSTNKKLEETRDLFIIGCLTGLRHSDYAKLKRSQIEEYKLHVKTVKGAKQLEISLRHPMIQAILAKYPKELPAGAVTQIFNQNLYEICKEIPQFKTIIETSITKAGKKLKESKLKCEMIKSHTARRSYCTNEVEAGTSVPIIMATSGHTSEKSFWKYVKLNKSHYFTMYDQIQQQRHGLVAI